MLVHGTKTTNSKYGEWNDTGPTFMTCAACATSAWVGVGEQTIDTKRAGGETPRSHFLLCVFICRVLLYL